MELLTKFISPVAILLIVGSARSLDNDGVYRVGVGISDITGPAAGVVLNGHLPSLVNAAGIYTRQFARAFAVESMSTGDVVAFVSTDMGMIDHSLKEEVVNKLRAKYGPELFSEKNVMISATHTHAGTSGYMTYFMYLLVESYGFNPVSFWNEVDGIYESIVSAYESRVEGRLFWNHGDLLTASRNRRREQYDGNPAEEIDLYPHDVDVEVTLLKIEDVHGNPLGAFSWFPVHPLAFMEGNQMISSDNVGYASLLFDYEMNPASRPGQGKFVSSFCSSNLGDVRPNNDPPLVRRRRRETNSTTRDEITEGIDRARNNGLKQFRKAFELFNDGPGFRPVTGPIRFIHHFMDTDAVEVSYFNETSQEEQTVSLCQAGMGFAYLNIDPEWWEVLEPIRDLIFPTSEEMKLCQAPKEVLLPAGEMSDPWEWAPHIVALQLFQIGDFDLVGVPGEYTTMAGRRLRNAVYNVTGHKVTIAGLTNNYINYVATEQEYDVQQYEGGATIYGRNTLAVTLTLFKAMASSLQNGSPSIPDGPSPPSYLQYLNKQVRPWADPEPNGGRRFGDVVEDVAKQAFSLVEDAEVAVTFAAGSPRNSPLRKGTFLVIEQRSDGVWKTHRTDGDVDTIYHWDWVNRWAELRWLLNNETELGVYRMKHFGYYRSQEDGPSMTYSGMSQEFEIVP